MFDFITQKQSFNVDFILGTCKRPSCSSKDSKFYKYYVRLLFISMQKDNIPVKILNNV